MIKLTFFIFISFFYTNISNAKDVPCWKVRSTLEVVKYAVPNFINKMKDCSEARDKKIKNYLEKFNSEKLKNGKIQAALATGVRGNLYSKFMEIPQKYVNDLTLSECEKSESKRKRPSNCSIIYEGKNIVSNGWVPNYNITKKILNAGFENFEAEILMNYRGVNFVRVFNNSQCGTIEQNIEKSFINAMRKELDIYPDEFLNVINFKFILVCNGLKGDSRVMGMAKPSNHTSTGYYFANVKWFSNERIKNNYKDIQRVFHHELFHMFEGLTKKHKYDYEWINLNNRKENDYLGRVNIATDKGYALARSIPGFISRYSNSVEYEDKAETFSSLIIDHDEVMKIASKDPVLLKKVELIKKRVQKAIPSIDENFWKNLN